MNLAQSLADLRQSPPEQWLRAANRTLPVVITAVLVLLIARELSSLTWTILSEPADISPVPGAVSADSSAPASGGTTADYSSLTRWRPFGEPPATAETVPAETILDAPETTLNLSLHGVHEVANPETGRAQPDRGSAMISGNRQEQQLYNAGDTIEGASGARLHSVFFDRVLLDRGGRLETLRLPLEVAANSPQPMARPMAINRSAASAPTGASLRDALSDNAAALSDIIRPTPQMEGGQMIGFRLTPGRNRDAFNAIGLRPGDVLTEVNGLVMNDPRAAMQVFSALSETTVASVTIMRNGTPEVMTIDMSLVETIMENSQ